MPMASELAAATQSRGSIVGLLECLEATSRKRQEGVDTSVAHAIERVLRRVSVPLEVAKAQPHVQRFAAFHALYATGTPVMVVERSKEHLFPDVPWFARFYPPVSFGRMLILPSEDGDCAVCANSWYCELANICGENTDSMVFDPMDKEARVPMLRSMAMSLERAAAARSYSWIMRHLFSSVIVDLVQVGGALHGRTRPLDDSAFALLSELRWERLFVVVGTDGVDGLDGSTCVHLLLLLNAALASAATRRTARRADSAADALRAELAQLELAELRELVGRVAVSAQVDASHKELFDK